MPQSLYIQGVAYKRCIASKKDEWENEDRADAARDNNTSIK